MWANLLEVLAALARWWRGQETKKQAEAEDDKTIADMDAAAAVVSDDADSVRLDPNNRDNDSGGSATG